MPGGGKDRPEPGAKMAAERESALESDTGKKCTRLGLLIVKTLSVWHTPKLSARASFCVVTTLQSVAL